MYLAVIGGQLLAAHNLHRLPQLVEIDADKGGYLPLAAAAFHGQAVGGGIHQLAAKKLPAGLVYGGNELLGKAGIDDGGRTQYRIPHTVGKEEERLLLLGRELRRRLLNVVFFQKGIQYIMKKRKIHQGGGFGWPSIHFACQRPHIHPVLAGIGAKNPFSGQILQESGQTLAALPLPCPQNLRELCKGGVSPKKMIFPCLHNLSLFV